jgi:hypothetical protein
MNIILDDWDGQLIDFLESIRSKSAKLSAKHTNKFFYYKSCSNYFDIPIIILSVLSSSFSVGTGDFLQQSVISLVSCSVSMIVAILSSIKLYLNISTNTNNELDISKEFHLLSLDIQKTLALPVELRKIDQLDFLNKSYDTFIVMLQKSSLIKADEERERMDTILDKIKRSPRLTMKRQPTLSPLQIPINNEVTFGD